MKKPYAPAVGPAKDLQRSGVGFPATTRFLRAPVHVLLFTTIVCANKREVFGGSFSRFAISVNRCVDTNRFPELDPCNLNGSCYDVPRNQWPPGFICYCFQNYEGERCDRVRPGNGAQAFNPGVPNPNTNPVEASFTDLFGFDQSSQVQPQPQSSQLQPQPNPALPRFPFSSRKKRHSEAARVLKAVIGPQRNMDPSGPEVAEWNRDAVKRAAKLLNSVENRPSGQRFGKESCGEGFTKTTITTQRFRCRCPWS